MFLIDTHCHLEDSRFDNHREIIIKESMNLGLGGIIVPSTSIYNFDSVCNVTKINNNIYYMLGIHPFNITNNYSDDLYLLYDYVKRAVINDPSFVGIGEIGLDFYNCKNYDYVDIQKRVFIEQLRIAEEFSLPIIIHSRKSHEDIIKILKNSSNLNGGFVHSFNGSLEQANVFIKLGFMIGIGGAFTYEKSLKIRNNARKLPLDSIVLETDSPNMPPSWSFSYPWNINSPCELKKISIELANFKNIPIEEVISKTTENVLSLIPKMRNYSLFIN